MDGQRAFLAWMKQQQQQQQPDIDWANVKIDPSELGVNMGPALTEEQFKEYCKATGTKQHVIKADPKKK